MNLDDLIKALEAIRDERGPDVRVLWWDWQPESDKVDPADLQNIELAQWSDETESVLLC